MLRTAILLPRSTLFPAFGIDILNGIKSSLRQLGIHQQIDLRTDNIGFGIDEADIYTKAEKFLLQEDVDAVMVVADIRIIELLSPLFAATNKLLLLVNLGADFPETWQPAPTTLVHSMNFCLHAQLTGDLAAEESPDKKGAYAISYYDGGYRQCYSMISNHQLSGGIPCYTHVTHFKTDEFTLAPLDDFLNGDPDVKALLCLFAGDNAVQFYESVLPLQEKHRLRLYVSPMMLDQSLSEHKLSVIHTKGHVPWTYALDNTANKTFITSFEALANKKANVFALLGWETGLLLAELLQLNDSGIPVHKMLSELAKKTFDSPRGWLKTDPNTFHTYGPSWLVEANGNMDITVVKEITELDTVWKKFTSQGFPKGESSSWRNTYLCI